MSTYPQPYATPEVRKESGMLGGEALDVLGRPQQALFAGLIDGEEGVLKGLSGDTDYSHKDVRQANPKYNSFMQGMGVPTGLTDLGADVFADPLSVIPISWLNKGKKFGGMLTGSSPNVIDDFYSTDPEKLFPKGWNPNKVEDSLKKGEDVPEKVLEAQGTYKKTLRGVELGLAIEKVTGVKLPAKVKKALTAVSSKDSGTAKDANLVLSAYYKGKGGVKWVGESIDNAFKALLSPSSRAMYAETGLTKVNQARIAKALKAGDDKTAVAQAQHAVYMAHRTGKPFDQLHPALQKVAEEMSIDGFQKIGVTSYVASANKAKKTLGGVPYATPNTVSSRLFNIATGNWGIKRGQNADKFDMVVRQPTGLSGDFTYDAAQKATGVSKGRTIFKNRGYEGFNNVDELKAAYEQAGIPVKSADASGIYIVNSAASTSYLEGGINVVTHVQPNGITNTVISDVYDFLENAPVVGKIEDSMERSLIGITPPITYDLRKPSKAAVSKDPAIGGTRNIADNQRTAPMDTSSLEALGDITPSTAGVVKENAKQAAGIAYGANMANKDSED